MSVIELWLRAVFVLPFTAGNPTESQDERTSHDGNISGVVFAFSVVAIHCSVLMTGYTNQQYFGSLYYVLIIIYTAIILLCITICLCVTVYVTVKKQSIVPKERLDLSARLMLKFLWFFTVGSMAYYGLAAATYINCFRSISAVHVAATCNVLMVVFRLVQTGFLTRFARYVFVNSIGIYFSLLMLFLINISAVAREYTQDIYDFHVALNKITNKTESCNSTVSDDLLNVSVYLIPVDFECSLVTIILIMDIWPTPVKHQPFKNTHSDNYCPLMETSRLIPKECEPVKHKYKSNTTQNQCMHKRWKFLHIFGATLLSLPVIVLSLLRIDNNNYQYGAKSFEISVIILVIFCGFYRLQIDCKPAKKGSDYGAKEYLILFSVIGSVGYYTMKVVPCIIMADADGSSSSKIYNYIIRIFDLYVQTVFIFQMKRYEKREKAPSCFSIVYCCLFLSVYNLLSWAFDSFLAPRYAYLPGATYLYYGQLKWNVIKSFLFPFVIFYRFKCFIAFYGIYYKLKKEGNEN